MHIITKSILKKVYGKRSEWSRKGDFGHLLIIGGSRHYTGSLAFNAVAALRSGCDLVTIAAPERAADIAARFAPDIIAYPLKGDHVKSAHVREMRALMQGKDALVIGGGLGRHVETVRAVHALLSKIGMPVVADADALHAVAKKKSLVRGNFVLTPHAGEFAALTGKKVGNDTNERIRAVKTYAARLGCTIVLKGAVDVISDGRRTAIDREGSPYMTKGGFGDILAGVCGSFLAQGVAPFDAACAAAYVTGKAGRMAAQKKKQGLLASDVLEEIPRVLA